MAKKLWTRSRKPAAAVRSVEKLWGLPRQGPGEGGGEEGEETGRKDRAAEAVDHDRLPFRRLPPTASMDAKEPPSEKVQGRE